MRWVLVGAVLVSSLYLTTLGTRFDFIDDGNLVYPTAAVSVSHRLHIVWHKIVANYRHLGPFRPVLWVHWETCAELFGGNAFQWRLARLGWLMLAVALFLWLLREPASAGRRRLADGPDRLLESLSQ